MSEEATKKPKQMVDNDTPQKCVFRGHIGLFVLKRLGSDERSGAQRYFISSFYRSPARSDTPLIQRRPS